MKLAIFDLDNTLLAGDSDHAWGEYLISQNLVDPDDYRQKNDAFYEDYKRGELDMIAYQEFVLGALKGFSADQLKELHQGFMQTVVDSMHLPKAQALVDEHRRQGHTLIVITATNRFITEDIVRSFGIPHLLCTEPEYIDGKLSGKISGIPCYQAGKIKKLESWLKENRVTPEYAWFYSDSFNDIPLMEKVDEAIAVDADDTLKQHAKNHGWASISLRD